ncbi:cupin domain-containing protein [Thiohalorhabdus methylotrophus]|uniref:Cupin domain-containing protein n=1 Tax=Thiohalorhabdus methylotrophus TaxID=3242694 RepID=A0ABV4TUG7_9GAMM
MSRNADYWIDKLGLTEHPEGGFFRETFRAPEGMDAVHLPDRYEGSRSYQTAIYFLLKSGRMSAFHRMESDELWFFHAGSAANIYCLHENGERADIRLGPDPEAGEALQAVVPRGTWFGAEVTEPDSFVLVSCTVAPGFEFDDFRLGSRAALKAQFPQHAELIERLTIEP